MALGHAPCPDCGERVDIAELALAVHRCDPKLRRGYKRWLRQQAERARRREALAWIACKAIAASALLCPSIGIAALILAWPAGPWWALAAATIPGTLAACIIGLLTIRAINRELERG